MGNRVLVAQYQPEIASLFVCLLNEEGYDASIAWRASGLEEKIAEEPPKLILLEATLPDAISVDMAKSFRDGSFGPDLKNVPIIVIDSFELIPANVAEQAVQDGRFTAYFSPPFSANALFSELAKHVQVGPDELPVPYFKFKRGNVERVFYTSNMFRFTGKVSVVRDGITKFIYFEDGQITGASSTLSTDRIGNLLVRHGRITETQLNQALVGLSKSNTMIGAELVSRGMIDEPSLKEFLFKQAEEIAQNLFEWTEFEVSFSREIASKKGVAMSIHPRMILPKGMEIE
jgi:CheY-like chemotaxis protein